MNFVMNLDIDDFIPLILQAIDKREERKAWEMWLMKYQKMDKNTFKPFSDFFISARQKIEPVTKKSTDEILKDAYEIRLKIAEKQKTQHLE